MVRQSKGESIEDFMESACVLEKLFVMQTIISDDDNVMRSHMQEINIADKKHKGKLEKWQYEPTFLTNPGPQKKSVAKHFYKLGMAPVGVSRVSKDMAKRFNKTWVISLGSLRTALVLSMKSSMDPPG